MRQHMISPDILPTIFTVGLEISLPISPQIMYRASTYSNLTAKFALRNGQTKHVRFTPWCFIKKIICRCRFAEREARTFAATKWDEIRSLSDGHSHQYLSRWSWEEYYSRHRDNQRMCNLSMRYWWRWLCLQYSLSSCLPLGVPRTLVFATNNLSFMQATYRLYRDWRACLRVRSRCIWSEKTDRRAFIHPWSMIYAIVSFFLYYEINQSVC